MHQGIIFSDAPRNAGNLTSDTHLAALALEHGADIVSYNRDFARFPGVKHRLPASAHEARS